MKKITRTLIASAAFGLIAAGSITAPASAISHDLTIVVSNKNAYSDMQICHGWDGHSSTDNEGSCYTEIRGLKNGHNTLDEFGWRDSDGVKVAAYYTLKEDKSGTDPRIYPCKDYTRFVKVSPTLLRHKRAFYQTRSGCAIPKP